MSTFALEVQFQSSLMWTVVGMVILAVSTLIRKVVDGSISFMCAHSD